MFTVSRHNELVFVDGYVNIQFDWAPAPERLNADQVGVFNVLEGLGFDVHGGPTAVGHVSQGSVRCFSIETAIAVENVLRKRVEDWAKSNPSCVPA